MIAFSDGVRLIVERTEWVYLRKNEYQKGWFLVFTVSGVFMDRLEYKHSLGEFLKSLVNHKDALTARYRPRTSC